MTAAVLLGVAAALLSAGTARAADCSLADYGYNGVCGPQFEQPAWGDGAGWTGPSKYSTIQLADLTGNGVDELIARNDDGIEIWRFDITLGQWRPAIGADGKPEVLTDFRSPLPSESGPNWNQPQYYKTIQTAALTLGAGRDIIARFPDGMRVYEYTPPKGTKSIDGGTWSLVSKQGPFSDADGYTDPSLYLTIHTDSASPAPFGWAQMVAQSKSGVVVYFWNGSGWKKEASPYGPYTADPAYYLNLQLARLPSKDGIVNALIERSGGGVVGQYDSGSGGTWHALGVRPNPGPFADSTSGPSVDCPFQSSEPNSQCFGSSPSYYETLRFADIDGQPGEEMLGRTSDGLRVYKLASDGSSWSPLAKLTDLGGSAFGSNPPPPGRWTSIQTADIGAGSGTQLLALDGTGLQAWSYDAAADKWSKLTPTPALNLGGDMWDNNPSYYSTIQAGDVTGSGHEAVIARGPFGIRTWFYDLHGTSGWTSYLPQDTSSYPAFSGGQAAAFVKLNELAKQHGLIPGDDSTLRDAWTGENPPSQQDLNTLQRGLLLIANCSGEISAAPPTYTTCAPPSGITAADWTAVVNEVLAEIYAAGNTLQFFNDLDRLRADTFLAKSAELPAIDDSVKQLVGAAGNQTSLDPKDLYAAGLGIAGSLAADVPGVGTALSVAAYIVGLLPSSSPDLTTKFEGTYADLQAKFAQAVTELDKTLAVQSLEVRQSWGLMNMISQLTSPTGPWAKIDYTGIKSSIDQGFALWVYQQLLPSLASRYHVTGCLKGFYLSCERSGTNASVLGDAENFDMIGAAPVAAGFSSDGSPCNSTGEFTFCTYQPLPDPLATAIWGPLSDTCNYTGDPLTVWTFGCNLGVSPQASISFTAPANGWQFTDYCGTPVVNPIHPDDSRCSPPGAQVTLRARGTVRLGGTLNLPRGFRARSASIDLPQLLYQASHLPQLVDASPGVRASEPLRLTVHGGAAGAKRASAGQASGQLSLAPVAAGGRRYSLTVTGVSLGVPAACQQLPASDALATPTVALNTVFVLSDGDRSRKVSVPSVWRCLRDRAGVITALAPAVAPRVAQRPGLSVSLSLPGRVVPGTTVSYRVKVSNRRRAPRDRTISSLWHVYADALVTIGASRAGARGARVTFAELRRGRTRALSFRVHLRHSASEKVCVTVTAGADSARPAAARRCAAIVNPPTTGLG